MARLWSEMVLLFVILPLAVFYWVHQVADMLLVILAAIGVYCLAILLTDTQFQRNKLWLWNNNRTHIKSAFKCFVPCAAIIASVVHVIAPERFLQWPLNDPWMWVMTLMLYPVISVIPQEIIFRTYFFHRYKRILPSKNARWALSTFVFGFAHLVYGNWFAVLITWCGGAVFGYRYMQTNSMPVVVIEHTLWGSFLFTVGLGSYLVIA